jgi:uncharacterized membrane protein YgdD (TMEM256/DUF423 family)
MSRFTLTLAAVLGLLAVALGAFGAHGLKSALEGADDAAKRLAWWDTAVRYQMWHALLLVGAGVLERAEASRALSIVRWAALIGVCLFSGSLFAMTLTNVTKLGMITPLGGLAFLVAWGAMFTHVVRR